MSNIKFFLLIIIFSIGIYIYFKFNESYELSLKARFYYAIEDYNKTYELSEQALKIREYNTMAFHLSNRAKASINIIDFIEESKNFEVITRAILEKEIQTKGEIAKIKMMCEIILSKYENLNKKFVEDNELLKLAEYYYLKFKKLHGEIVNGK